VSPKTPARSLVTLIFTRQCSNIFENYWRIVESLSITLLALLQNILSSVTVKLS